MTLLLSELPGTHAEVVGWLEGHLVGLQLSRLVTELAAVHGAQRPAESIRGVLGAELSSVLADGLRVLSPQQLGRLMKQPFHLFELQELVLAAGGAHWQQRMGERPLPQRIEPNWQPDEGFRPEPKPRGRSMARGVALVAVGLLVGFATCYLWLVGPVFPPKRPQPPQVASVWGWNKPDATAKAETSRAYLTRLSDLVEEWYAGVPEADAPNRKLLLAIRLLELRSGCTRLSLTDHPLPAEQRDKLKARAAGWCKDIDILLQNVQEANDLTVWTPSIDKLVQQMADDLRAGRLDR
jgi:hypothetical protein